MSFSAFFSAAQWSVVSAAGALARKGGEALFAVGGVVRDYLLHSRHPPIDIDLVVEGDGIALAVALHRQFPEARLLTHPKFLTAELLFPHFTIDIATARREHYAFPGANPMVSPCSLWEDLERRDFTVNALATPIAAQDTSFHLIDRFGGEMDLSQRWIRAIRSDSFIEDPRRIFRAIRFAVKLGFGVAPPTHQEISATIAGGIHQGLGGSRLRSELLYILQPNFFPVASASMLQWLSQMQALSCVHPQLVIPEQFSLQMRRLGYWHKYFARDKSLDALALELVLAPIAVEQLVERELLVAGASTKRLEQCSSLQITIDRLLRQPSPASTIVETLHPFDPGALSLYGASCNQAERKLLWQFLTRWQHITPLLNGTDLQSLGCPPGKQLGLLLRQLRAQQIDGKITSITAAKQYVQEWLATLPATKKD